MLAPGQGVGRHAREPRLQRCVDEQLQDIGLIHQQIVRAAAEDDAVFRLGQLLDYLGLKAEEVARGDVVVAVGREYLARVDLLGRGEHLAQADALVRRAEQLLVDAADLGGLAQQVAVVVRHAQRVRELARYVVAAAARLTGDGDYESSHLTPPFKLRGTPCAPGRPQRAPRPRPPWRCCRSRARRPCR